MVNIHWMTRGSLIELLNKGELFRGRNGTVKINDHNGLQGQISRESVWTYESSVGITESKGEK